jgi:hypothetical protein
MAVGIEVNFSALAAKINGNVILPGNEGYKQAIHHWAGNVDRNPAAVAHVATASDVSDAVLTVFLE